MRRHELSIERHGQVHTLQEVIGWDGRDGNAFCGPLHAGCVLGGAEDGDGLVAWVTEGFETFVALLAVVEAGGHAVEGEVGRAHKAGGGPFAGGLGVGRLDVSVYFADLEADVGPVD